MIPVKNKNSKHHHRTLHISISLDTKFQLKVKILGFQTKLTQKGYLRSKIEKVNITIEF